MGPVCQRKKLGWQQEETGKRKGIISDTKQPSLRCRKTKTIPSRGFHADGPGKKKQSSLSRLLSLSRIHCNSLTSQCYDLVAHMVYRFSIAYSVTSQRNDLFGQEVQVFNSCSDSGFQRSKIAGTWCRFFLSCDYDSNQIPVSVGQAPVLKMSIELLVLQRLENNVKAGHFWSRSQLWTALLLCVLEV